MPVGTASAIIAGIGALASGVISGVGASKSAEAEQEERDRLVKLGQERFDAEFGLKQRQLGQGGIEALSNTVNQARGLSTRRNFARDMNKAINYNPANQNQQPAQPAAPMSPQQTAPMPPPMAGPPPLNTPKPNTLGVRTRNL
jgi:hypothetical protein